MKALLVVGHPGHELRVYRWLELTRPEVHVLTDGSGAGGQSRVASTLRLLAGAGARPGSVMGRFTDREAYRILLEGQVSALAPVVYELAGAIARSGADVVAGDAIEGFNPVHDLCRVMLERALELAAHWTGRRARNLEFLLDGEAAAPGPEGWQVVLDAAALRRKHDAAQAYTELQAEVQQVRERVGEGIFDRESLRPAEAGLPLALRVPDPPFYERYGEERVAAGRYDRVLRLSEHFLPLAAELAVLTPAGAPAPRLGA